MLLFCSRTIEQSPFIPKSFLSPRLSQPAQSSPSASVTQSVVSSPLVGLWRFEILLGHHHVLADVLQHVLDHVRARPVAQSRQILLVDLQTVVNRQGSEFLR